MERLLSIITITRDDPHGLRATLESTQTLLESEAVEQIVVDSSREPLQVSDLRRPNLQIHHQPPQGVSAAFNLGLSNAEGRYIWFLNGEDTVHESLSREFLLGYLGANRADASIFEMESAAGISRRPAFFTLWPPVFNWIPHPSTIMRTEVLRSLGGFREDFRAAMDVELWIRLLSSDALVDLISLPLARFAPAGISSNQKLVAREIRRAMWIHRKTLRACYRESGHRVWRAWKRFSRFIYAGQS